MKTYVIAGVLGLWLTFLSAAEAQQPNSSVLTKQGSLSIHRSEVDGDDGQVYIYVGGSFPQGTQMLGMQYLFDFTQTGNTFGYMTPLLLERVSGELVVKYVVRGIGKGLTVYLSSVVQTIPFEIVAGETSTTNANYTFGYVNALVDANGKPTMSSAGTVDMDNPTVGGNGVGGSGTTNHWAVTSISPNPIVALGTTFAVTGADYPFFLPLRTYSAQVRGIVK